MIKKAVPVMGLMLAACSPKADARVADGAIADFHQKLDAGQFGAIYAMADPSLKASTTNESLTRLLSAVHRKLGAFDKGHAVGWSDSQTIKGHFLSVKYAAQYARGEAAENFVYRIDDDRAVLNGYYVTSDALILN
ncbi:MAG: DUF4019 domain-containing protein [Sphingomonas sp.]